VTRDVVFRPQAEHEALEVRRWSESRQQELGDEFGAAINELVNRIAEFPLKDVLSAARDVPVQIAHLAGAGGYDDPAIDQALSVFVEAIAAADRRMAHVYFDASGVAGLGQWVDKKDLIATRIRQLEVRRVLYGSDGAAGDNLRPREAWAAFRQLPLSEAEFHAIETNVASYMR
jgi:uncharacterized protein